MSKTTTAAKVKERPILFSGPMIRALMEGCKTQTRRIVKPQPIDNTEVDGNFYAGDHSGYVKVDGHPNWQEQFAFEFCPFGRPGDILWVRETWQITDFLHPSDENFGYIYRASENGQDWKKSDESWKWRPSIFMPKEAARIYLLNEGVRVQRLGDISEEDAIAEGVQKVSNTGQYFNYMDKTRIPANMWVRGAVASFQSLWQSINGEWNPDLWIWAVTFRVLSTTGKPNL